MRRLVVLGLMLTVSSLLAAQAKTPGQPPATPAPPVTAEPVRLAHPLGDSFLLLPTGCKVACPLVIVSHSRGMSAEDSLKRPHLARLFEKFNRAGVAVLVSDDAGGRSWGEETALQYIAEVREQALAQFPSVGNTYTMGYSMGGLPALLVAYRKLFPVSGVLLLDARVNLLDAWQGADATRKQEIAQAHGVTVDDPLPVGVDPFNDYREMDHRRVPVFVAGSPDDQTVPFRSNGEALFARSLSRESKLLPLTGPHLGASHFGDAVADAMLAFVTRQEHLARAAARKRPVEALVSPGTGVQR